MWGNGLKEKVTMNNNRVIVMTAVLMVFGLSSVQAQNAENRPVLIAAEMKSMPGMDHSKMNHGAMPDSEADAATLSGQKMQHNMDSMDAGSGMSRGRMQGGSAPADARSPDYSDGYDFGEIARPVLADEHNFASLLVDRLEAVRTDDNSSLTYDLQGWFGRDYDRAVIKAEGDIDGGKLEDASTELLWSHAIATFWDAQLGVRFDNGDAPDRTLLSFGVQGLARYWFELDATAYVGSSGRTAFNLEAEYDLLLTQKWILQPRFETDWYSKSDAARGLGDGLSDLSLGLRLRYEIRREVAPYVGVEWVRKFGESKDFARADGQEVSDAHLVAGLRFWF
jgi:copper resistance protein B